MQGKQVRRIFLQYFANLKQAFPREEIGQYHSNNLLRKVLARELHEQTTSIMNIVQYTSTL